MSSTKTIDYHHHQQQHLHYLHHLAETAMVNSVAANTSGKSGTNTVPPIASVSNGATTSGACEKKTAPGHIIHHHCVTTRHADMAAVGSDEQTNKIEITNGKIQ